MSRIIRVSGLLFIFCIPVLAQVPEQINWQGYLTNASDEQLNGPVDLSLRLFDAIEAGTQLYRKDSTGVVADEGVVSVPLGPFPGVDFGQPLFLEVWVQGVGALSPRSALTSVPYALAVRGVLVNPGGRVGINVPSESLTSRLTVGGRIESRASAPGIEGGQLTLLDADGLGGWEIDTQGDSDAEKLRIFRNRGYSDVNALVVENTGNVGIGEGSPETRLHVRGSLKLAGAQSGLIFPDGTTQTTAASGSGDGHSLDADDGSPVDAVYVDATGNVGIGTTTPGAALDINVPEGQLRLTDSDDGNFFQFNLNSDSLTLVNKRPGAEEFGLLRLKYTQNPAARAYNVILGARNVVAEGVIAGTISGGGGEYYTGEITPMHNRVASDYGTVGGGYNNQAEGLGSTIGGGGNNLASGYAATVGGGYNNRGATGEYATIAGGAGNRASGLRATVGGGGQNTASGPHATVGGGEANQAAGTNGTVGGGSDNTAYGGFATVSGGDYNTARGWAATVPGGSENIAGGNFSFAAGNWAHVRTADETGDPTGPGDEGTFVWSDGRAGEFMSTGMHQFLIHATGGVGIGTNNPDGLLHISGTDLVRIERTDTGNALLALYATSGTGWRLISTGSDDPDGAGNFQIRDHPAGMDRLTITPDGLVGIGTPSPAHPLAVGSNSTNGNGAHVTAGGVWTNGSSRTFKHGFVPIDTKTILKRVAELPVTRWVYEGENDAEHIGPVAEDFYEAFGLGSDERYIGTVDADGVALAAIQGLYELVQELRAENQELRAMIEAIER